MIKVFIITFIINFLLFPLSLFAQDLDNNISNKIKIPNKELVEKILTSHFSKVENFRVIQEDNSLNKLNNLKVYIKEDNQHNSVRLLRHLHIYYLTVVNFILKEILVFYIFSIVLFLLILKKIFRFIFRRRDGSGD